MAIIYLSMFLYICEKCVRSVMFSPEFMKYLINYQKNDFKPEETQKEINFKDSKGGRLAEIFLTLNK